MPYTANVPLANQQISASQPIINANFQALLAAFNANHTDLLTSTGRHSFVQLAPQAPTPAFAGTPGFWSSTAAGNPIMLHTAAGADRNISEYTWSGADGSTVLPSGLIMKWGFIASGGVDAPYTLTFAAPFPTSCFSVWATIYDSGANPQNHYYISVSAYSRTRFILQRYYANAANMANYNALRNNGFFWCAIGI